MCNLKIAFSQVRLITPEQLHYGKADDIYSKRKDTLKEAFEGHPERFKGKIPKPPELPQAAWINKPEQGEETYFRA